MSKYDPHQARNSADSEVRYYDSQIRYHDAEASRLRKIREKHKAKYRRAQAAIAYQGESN